MLRIDDRNPRARALVASLGGPGALEGLQDLVVVVGGDGFLLKCIHEGGFDQTYLGLNAGTVGFLLNDVKDPQEALSRLQAGAYTAHSFPLLQGTATAPDGSVSTSLGLNDVHLERTSGHTAHLRITVNGVEIVGDLACDGLVIATSLGSTAYSYSAGGPPCHPLVEAIHLTPICAHNPKLSPLTLPATTSIEVQALQPDRRPVRAYADGVAFDGSGVQTLHIARSEIRANVAFFEGHEFTRVLVEKLLH